MAFESPAWANSGGTATYSAEQTRRAVFSAFARTSANTPGIISGGLLSTADLALTAPGSGLSVNVGTGECIVGGSEGGVQGGYYAYNAASVNLSISAANPSNPRIDTVAVTISDGSYTEPTGGSGNQVAAQVVTGTPTAGATLTNLSGVAALPASSLRLGYVLVPAGASNIITADIANVATQALGQFQPINPHGYEWSYAQITSPVNVTSTTEATGTTILSPAAFTPDGGPVMVEFFCPYVVVPTAAAGNSTIVSLFEGSTQISRLAAAFDQSTSGAIVSLTGRYRFTPTNASHTYTVTAHVTNTTGTPGIGAGAGGTGTYPPAFVRFTKV